VSFLLDTNVLSQSSKPIPNIAVMDWIATNDAGAMFLSVISLAEVRVGIGTMAAGKRKAAIADWLEISLVPHFQGRILPITEEVANDCGDLIARCRKGGHTVQVMDALIAATARVHHLSVVTLNRRHFEPLQVSLVPL
jgi:toxin FitB